MPRKRASSKIMSLVVVIRVPIGTPGKAVRSAVTAGSNATLSALDGLVLGVTEDKG